MPHTLISSTLPLTLPLVMEGPPSFGMRLGLRDKKPKDVAPSIFPITKQKNLAVHKAFGNDFWIGNLNLAGDMVVNHIYDFYNLLSKINEIVLTNGA
jgi:hypothetical protein